MKGAFFIVGPTATGKSEIAAEVAALCGGEIVGADAFQIYAGLPLLTAKPDTESLRRVPHHLLGNLSLGETMNAERYRQLALQEIQGCRARSKSVFIVGGSGLYVKALTDGLSPLPSADAALRERLDQCSEGELLVRLSRLDPETARTIDQKNKRRLVRALEICLQSGGAASELRRRVPSQPAHGVLLFRDREELCQRINLRVEMMFAAGVIDEVQRAGPIGPTAAQTLGLAQIRALLAGEISEAECVAAIQQKTRRYAKRQLTWFRRQHNFEPLNLSHHSSSEAVASIARKARLSFAQDV